MKKWICMALCLMLCLSGMVMAEEEAIRIGVLLPELTGGEESAAAWYAEQRCIEQGAEYVIAVCPDEETMLDELAEMQIWGAQAIVVWPGLPGDAEALQAAAEDGVAVICMNEMQDIPGARLAQADEYDIGVQQAYYLAEKLEGVGTVAVFSADTAAAKKRLQGLSETLEEIAPAMKLLETVTIGENREEAAVAMAALLDGQQQVDGVWASDDAVALGAYDAIVSAQRTDVYVLVSCGGRQEFFETSTEREDMWLATLPRTAALAYESVDMAVMLARNEAVEAERLTSGEMIDRENVSAWLEEGSLYR